jgi:hypothetical protein
LSTKEVSTKFSIFEGFKLRAVAETEKKIASLSYNWFATNDPKIHIEYVRTKDMGELSND